MSEMEELKVWAELYGCSERKALKSFTLRLYGQEAQHMYVKREAGNREERQKT